MPKVSFRMASASRESVFGVQTSTARKIHRSDHTEGRLTTTPSGCCVRKGTACGPETLPVIDTRLGLGLGPAVADCPVCRARCPCLAQIPHTDARERRIE